MGGKQAGCVGLLTLVALRHNILTVVVYDEIIAGLSAHLHLPISTSIKDQADLLSRSDLLISVHGREIVPNKLLELPKLGCINLHPCLYKYKGMNPVNRMLKDKETMASVGSHYMTDKVDEGEVIVEDYFNVAGSISAEEVYNRLYPIYSHVLIKTLDRLMWKIR
jgi:methionyl-tRNA formyltransferase